MAPRPRRAMCSLPWGRVAEVVGGRRVVGFSLAAVLEDMLEVMSWEECCCVGFVFDMSGSEAW